MLYQLEASELVRRRRGAHLNRMSGMSDNWFEIRLDAVTQVEIRPLKLFGGHRTGQFLKKVTGDQDLINRSGVEIIYDRRKAVDRGCPGYVYKVSEPWSPHLRTSGLTTIHALTRV